MWRKVKNYIISTLNYVYTPINKWIFGINGVKFGKKLSIRGIVKVYNPHGALAIGDRVRINSAEWANPIGFYGRTIFQIVGNGEIVIGNDCGISNAAFTSAKRIEIGSNVLIGAGVKLYDTDFHPLNANFRNSGKQDQEKVCTASIKIGDGSFIGAGSIILKGVTIGNNAVIGAGSVVTKDIPANEIWAGNPAKYIKKNK